jgi:hypothetical protein
MMKVHSRLLSAYNALLYGSGPTRDTLWGSKGSLFASSTQGAHKFFELKGRCFRHDAENCLTPGQPLYQVTCGTPPAHQRCWPILLCTSGAPSLQLHGTRCASSGPCHHVGCHRVQRCRCLCNSHCILLSQACCEPSPRPLAHQGARADSSWWECRSLTTASMQ